MSQINYKCSTACKNCAFAVYNGKTQIDCDLNLLTKYEEILDCYDADKEFFVINNTVCLYKRNKEWLSRYKDKKTILNTIRQEIQLKYQAIIFCDKENWNELVNSINSLKSQLIPPQHITIILQYNVKYNPELLAQLFDKSNIKWRVENLLVSGSSFRESVDLLLINANLRYPWYILLEQGFLLPHKYVFNLDTLINEKMKNILIVKPQDHINGLIVNSMLHEYLNGNRSGNIESKIHTLCINYQEIA